MLTIDVGISDQDGFTTTDPRIRRRRLLRRVADAGLDHVTMAEVGQLLRSAAGRARGRPGVRAAVG
jgi:hypothetical protein